MVTEVFGSLLQEVGKIFNVPLQPDENNSCLLKLPTGISVQMDLEPSRTYFIIGFDLGTIPIGKYRGSVFRQALRANSAPYPRCGTFAYSKQKDHFILFEMLPIRELTGEKIVQALLPLSEKALVWQTAISQGEVPTVEMKQEKPGASLGNLMGFTK